VNVIKTVLPALLALACQQQVWALEQSAAVKAATVLKTESSWDGAPIVYPEGKAEITGMVIEIAPGGETGWHLHPVPSFGMVLEGALEVQLKSGELKRLNAGEALAEVVNTLHNGRNVGAVPVKLIVFYTSAVGQKLSVKEDSH
jgi:quercetin dioxygenase-like cupin family protein